MKSKEKDTQDFTNGSRIIVLDEHDFDGSWVDSEEGKKKLAEIKELLKDKELGDYSNPGPIINKIYLPKRYLKWEDLEFKDIQQKIKVKLGNLIYSLWYNLERGDQCIELTRNQQQVITLYGSYPEDILFFNNLRLERAE